MIHYSAYLVLFTKAILGFVLVSSSTAKLVQALNTFEQVVRSYALLPDSLAPVVARVLPMLELVLGSTLLIVGPNGIATALTSFVAATLFVVFAAAIAINLLRGRRDLSCGCWGLTQNRLHAGLVVRNGLLSVLCIALAGEGVSAPRAGVGASEQLAITIVAAAVLTAVWLTSRVPIWTSLTSSLLHSAEGPHQ